MLKKITHTIFNYFTIHNKQCIAAAIIWTGVIFYGCSLPGAEIPKISIFQQADKIAHFTFFFLFAFLWAIVARNVRHIFLILLFVSIIYGFGIEFYQKYFVAGRSFDIWDGIADTLGAYSALILIKKLGA